MAFAEVSDLEARWRTLSESEAEQAETLLADASAMLSRLAVVDSSDSAQAELLKIVTCDMVKRSMASSEAIGVDQFSITAGPYSQTQHFAATSGDLYLTKLEKRLLGITSSYIGSIPPKIGDSDD